MAKLTLSDLVNLDNPVTAVSTLNLNNNSTEVALENTLSRDGTSPNQMLSNFDMNSFQILNLPAPVSVASPLRLQDLVSFIGGGTVSTLPAGGTTGQVLAKTSNVDYATGWTGTPVFTTVNGLTLTSGTGVLTLNANTLAVAGSSISIILGTTTTGSTVTFQGTDTYVGRATVDTLTNKTFNTAGAGNVFQINGTGITAITGTGAAVLATSATLVTPTLSQQVVDTINFNGSSSGTTKLTGPAVGTSKILTLPDITDTVITKNSSDTLTNKVFNTASTGNQFYINSNQLLTNTGTGSVNVLQTSPALTSPTLTTPVLGVATATSINGSIVSPGHYSGEPSTGNSLAGEIGEVIQSNIASGSAIALTTGTPVNLTSISLTAGDWDVHLTYIFNPAGTTSVTATLSSISQTTGTRDLTTGGAACDQRYAAVVPASQISQTVGPIRIQLSGTTTIYGVIQGNFTVSTANAYGILRARRMR